MSEYLYKRVLIKISGEALSAHQNSTHSSDIYNSKIVHDIAKDLGNVAHHGVQLAVVIGGGNILRGQKISTDFSIDRSTADTMGMLATIINALALQSALEAHGARCRVLSGIAMSSVCEPFVRRRAIRHLEKGRIVIFAAGTGNPYFTTDTAAALRALEIEADVLLKATNVSGVFCSDPTTNPEAVFYENLTYQQAIDQNLQVMDSTAFTLLRDSKMPMKVFSVHAEHSVHHVLLGKGQFTSIS